MQAHVAPKLRQIVAEAVFRRSRLVLATFGGVVLTALALTLAMHKHYEAHAKLIVQNVRSAAQLTTNSVDHLVSQGDVSPAEINTEVNLLSSDGVARRALGLSERTVNDERRVREVERFKKQLTVEAVHQTDVIDLRMLGGSPEQAQANLQHVIDAYFEERAGNARNSGAAGFFDSQLQQEAQQLNSAQAALTQFGLQHGIADLDDQTKLQVARLSTLQDQLGQTNSALAAARSKLDTQHQELDGTAERSRTQLRTITNQYTQERLNTALVDLQNRRSELLRRYVPTDRQIAEIDDKILTTRRAINEASLHPATEEATDANPVWIQLRTQVAALGGDISGLDAQRSTLDSQIGAARQRLDELEESAAEYGELRRRLQQAQTEYALYAQRRDEARVSEALDRQKLFDVAVTQGPLASAEPVRPRPVLYMLVATIFGLLLGMTLAVYADLAGGYVYTPAQLDSWTGLRTWATLADQSRERWAEAVNRRQLMRLLFAIRQALDGGRRPLLGDGTRAGQYSHSVPMPPLGAGSDARGLCIAFTSALDHEGVSFAANHLAMEACLQSSSRVAVLDSQALLESLAEEDLSALPLRLLPGSDHWVLPAATGSDAALGTARGLRRPNFSSRLRSVMQQVRSDFDLVLLDCPSLQSSVLAGELAPCIDGYVAVVRAGKARRQNVEDLTSQLASTNAPLLGYVLNGREYPVPRWLHKMI